MNMIDKINYQQQKLSHISFKAQETIDKKENPKQEKNVTEYAKLTALMFSAALLATGAIAVVKKGIDSKANTLSCGIKRSEISSDLFNFLKRQLAQTSNFSLSIDKEQTLELDKLINSNNSAAFKKIVTNGSLSSQETISTLKVLNDDNINFIDTIFEKFQKEANSYSGYKLEKDDFYNIIRRINANNKENASGLISMAKVKYENPRGWLDSLYDILDFVDDKTKDNFNTIFNSRKNGIKTSFSYDELKSLANSMSGRNNAQAATLFLELKASNGINYYYDLNELEKIIKHTDDKFIDTYRMLADNQEKGFLSIAGGINDDSVDAAKIIIQNSIDKNIDLDCNTRDFIMSINSYNKDIAKQIAQYLIDKDTKIDSYHSGFIEATNSDNIDAAKNIVQNLVDNNLELDYRHRGFIQSYNSDNKDIADLLLKKLYSNNKNLSYNSEDLLSSVTKENKEVYKYVIDKCKPYDGYYCMNVEVIVRQICNMEKFDELKTICDKSDSLTIDEMKNIVNKCCAKLNNHFDA